MSKCQTCKHWSEVMAESREFGVAALCMSDGPKARRWTYGQDTCEKFEDGLPTDLEHVPPGQRAASIAYRRKASA